MRNIEIISKFIVKPPGHEIGFKIDGNTPDLGWEDVLLALQGIPPGRFAFLMYAYNGDEQARHSFFAELFMDVMQHLVVHRWILDRKSEGDYHREVEAMCQLAVEEWQTGNYARGTQRTRAAFMDVSRGTWRRRYDAIYHFIALRPSEWETEIMKIVTARLR
jgi:hypothetical protein